MKIQNTKPFDTNRCNTNLIMLGLREFSDKLRQEFDDREAEMKADFEAKMAEIKRKSAEELSTSKAEMIAKLKANYGELQWKTITLNLTHIYSVFLFEQNPIMKSSKQTKRKNNWICNETTSENCPMLTFECGKLKMNVLHVVTSNKTAFCLFSFHLPCNHCE